MEIPQPSTQINLRLKAQKGEIVFSVPTKHGAHTTFDGMDAPGAPTSAKDKQTAFTNQMTVVGVVDKGSETGSTGQVRAVVSGSFHLHQKHMPNVNPQLGDTLYAQAQENPMAGSMHPVVDTARNINHTAAILASVAVLQTDTDSNGLKGVAMSEEPQLNEDKPNARALRRLLAKLDSANAQNILNGNAAAVDAALNMFIEPLMAFGAVLSHSAAKHDARRVGRYLGTNTQSRRTLGVMNVGPRCVTRTAHVVK